MHAHLTKVGRYWTLLFFNSVQRHSTSSYFNNIRTKWPDRVLRYVPHEERFPYIKLLWPKMLASWNLLHLGLQGFLKGTLTCTRPLHPLAHPNLVGDSNAFTLFYLVKFGQQHIFFVFSS